MENVRAEVNRLFADAYLKQQTFCSEDLKRVCGVEGQVLLPPFPNKINDFYQAAIDSLVEVRCNDAAIENSLLALKKALESVEKAATELKTYHPETYKDIDRYGRLQAHREDGRPNKASFDLIGDDLLTEIRHRKFGLSAKLSIKDLPEQSLVSGKGVLRAPKRQRAKGFSDNELGALVNLWRRSLGLIDTDITDNFVNDVSQAVTWHSISNRRGHFSMIAALIFETSQEAICKRIRDRAKDCDLF